VPNISSQTAIIDTGTALIVLPAVDADAVNQFLGAIPLFDEYGLYAIDCHKDNKPTIKFVLAGETFAIGPSHYILPVGKNRCVTAFAASTTQDLSRWVIGTSFLRAWHTTFDVEKFEVRLARAVQADDSADALGADGATATSLQSPAVANRQLASIIDALITGHQLKMSTEVKSDTADSSSSSSSSKSEAKATSTSAKVTKSSKDEKATSKAQKKSSSSTHTSSESPTKSSKTSKATSSDSPSTPNTHIHHHINSADNDSQ
ncbi:hypothetical protein GGI00_006666, partial [Coemansia sp. RSA 2681]